MNAYAVRWPTNDPFKMGESVDTSQFKYKTNYSDEVARIARGSDDYKLGTCIFLAFIHESAVGMIPQKDEYSLTVKKSVSFSFRYVNNMFYFALKRK